MRPWIATTVSLAALFAGGLPAQMALTLTDGTTTRGSFAGIAKDGSWTFQGGSGPLKIPPGRVVALEAGDAPARIPDEGFRIELLTGDSLIGRIEDGSSDDLRLRNPAFGEVTFPLDDIAAIWNLAVPRAPETLPPPEATEGASEVLYLDREGRIDHIPGTLERIGKTQLVFSSKAGKNRVFAYARDPKIVALKSSAARKAPPAVPGGRSILRLKDGTRLTGTLKPSDGAAIAIKLTAGPELAIDSRAVRSLTIANESLRYLSDFEPASFVETPLIGGAVPLGLRKDSGLGFGQPLQVGRRTFTKGLLLPARSRVAWALDGQFSRFSAMVGADGGAEGGDFAGSVRATVFVDGKAAWTSSLIRAGHQPEPVEVGGLSGAKELAIEVDFGDSFDAGARAVFGNAMLIR